MKLFDWLRDLLTILAVLIILALYSFSLTLTP